MAQASEPRILVQALFMFDLTNLFFLMLPSQIRYNRLLQKGIHSLPYLTLLLLAILISSPATHAQIAYGITSSSDLSLGGGLGSIFKHDFQTGTTSAIFPWERPLSGENPEGKLLEYNGKFYGTTNDGGADHNGILYEIDIATGASRTLFSFSSTDGYSCQGGVTEYNGKLYGVTTSGGANFRGVIFEYDLATDTYTKKFDMASTTGNIVYKAMVLNNGKFYGVTAYGGTNGHGVIFEWNPATNAYAVVHEFDNTNGSRCSAQLIEVGGIFYGVTSEGGIYAASPWTHGTGTLFSFDPATHTFQKLHDWVLNTDGFFPASDLSLYNGKLYGVCRVQNTNGFRFFSWDLATSTLTPYTAWSESNGAINAHSGLGLAQVGSEFYLATIRGGVSPAWWNDAEGTIVKWNPATDALTKIHQFLEDDDEFGLRPSGALLLSGGKLYGPMYEGGSTRDGTILEFDPSDNGMEIMALFDKGTGGQVQSEFTEVAGKLYAVSQQEGDHNNGVLFEYDPATDAYTEIQSFGNGVGSGTYNADQIEVGGKLYGNLTYGGNDGSGTLYEYDPATSTFSVLHHFTYNTAGSPEGILTESNGKIYGTTTSGGTAGRGVIYEFEITTNTLTVLYSFPDRTDALGLNWVNGKLYGLSEGGGVNGDGSIFEFDLATSTFTSLFSFGSPNGRRPAGGLTELNGKLYGATSSGGANSRGIMFNWDIAGGTFTKMYDLDNTTGGRPRDGQFTAYNGKLYGIFPSGGTTYGGLMFEYDPATNTYSTVFEFDNQTTGAYSYGMGPVILNSCAITFTTSKTDEFCYGAADGSITIDASGATNYEYSIDGGANWTAASNPHTFTGLDNGGHDVMVRDADNTSCVAAAQTVAIAEGIRVDFTTSIMDATCTLRDDGSIEVTGVGDAPFSYSIDGGTFTGSGALHTFTSLVAGDYLIQVQDNNGCLSEARNVATGAASPPSFDVDVVHESAPSASDGSITLTVTEGTPTFEFSVDGGSNYVSVPGNTHTFTGLTIGIYQLRVEDGNNCRSARVPAMVSGAGFCPPTNIIEDLFTFVPTNAHKDERFICEDNIADLTYEIIALPAGNNFYFDWEISGLQGSSGKYATYNGTPPATDGSVGGSSSPVTTIGYHGFDLGGGVLGVEDGVTGSSRISVAVLPYLVQTDGTSCPSNPDTWKLYIYQSPEASLDNANAPGSPIVINSGDDPAGLIEIEHTGNIKEGSGLLIYDVHIDANPDIIELTNGLDLTDVGSLTDIRAGHEFDPVNLGLTSLTNTSTGPVTITVSVTPKYDPDHSRAASKDPVNNPNGYCEGSTETIDITILAPTARRNNTFMVNGQELLFRVYPVPSYGHLFLQSSQTLEQDQPFQVLNMLGQSIESGFIPAGEHRQKISTERLSAGIYMIRFLNPSGKDVVVKFEKR